MDQPQSETPVEQFVKQVAERMPLHWSVKWSCALCMTALCFSIISLCLVIVSNSRAQESRHVAEMTFEKVDAQTKVLLNMRQRWDYMHKKAYPELTSEK